MFLVLQRWCQPMIRCFSGSLLPVLKITSLFSDCINLTSDFGHSFVILPLSNFFCFMYFLKTVIKSLLHVPLDQQNRLILLFMSCFSDFLGSHLMLPFESSSVFTNFSEVWRARHDPLVQRHSQWQIKDTWTLLKLLRTHLSIPIQVLFLAYTIAECWTVSSK